MIDPILLSDIKTQLQILPLFEDAIDGDLTSASLALALESAIQTEDGLELNFCLGFPCDQFKEAWQARIQAALSSKWSDIKCHWRWQINPSAALNTQHQVVGVKHIVAVLSGKGGVGKSTTTVNLALALAADGARVGILDADIYGPSQALMLGVANQRPEILDGTRMMPIVVHGLHMISMGNLVSDKTPMIWRGPMVSGALQQLLNQTQWPDLDYLLVDMPPGTGDIHLTLSQSVPVTGAVVVTTPQDMALLDARKAIEMCHKVRIPVLGIVENMAVHICSECGHHEAIFGTLGGTKLANQYQVNLLGQLPLAKSICDLADAGTPSLVAEPHSAIAILYHQMASKIAALLWLSSIKASTGPTIMMTDD